MSRIKKTFAELKKRGEAALIPFITAGDPDLATTLKIMRALAANGADCIELGIPFSDPTADGPTIQRSSERALKKPVSLTAIFRLVREFRSRRPMCRLFYSAISIRFFASGLNDSCARPPRPGADGVLCVDLPPEESGELKQLDRRRRTGSDISFVTDQRGGPLAPRGTKGERLHLLCFSDGRDRRTPFFRQRPLRRKSPACAKPQRCLWALALGYRRRNKRHGSLALPMPLSSAAR